MQNVEMIRMLFSASFRPLRCHDDLISQLYSIQVAPSMLCCVNTFERPRWITLSHMDVFCNWEQLSPL